MTLALQTLAAMPRLVSESAGKPRPFRADDGSNGAKQKGDHQPAHDAILPGTTRCEIGSVRPALRLLPWRVWPALVLPGRAAASTEAVALETSTITVTAFEVARGVRLGRFRCVVEHDVTLASGPGGFASPSIRS